MGSRGAWGRAPGRYRGLAVFQQPGRALGQGPMPGTGGWLSSSSQDFGSLRISRHCCSPGGSRDQRAGQRGPGGRLQRALNKMEITVFGARPRGPSPSRPRCPGPSRGGCDAAARGRRVALPRRAPGSDTNRFGTGLTRGGGPAPPRPAGAWSGRRPWRATGAERPQGSRRRKPPAEDTARSPPRGSRGRCVT